MKRKTRITTVQSIFLCGVLLLSSVIPTWVAITMPNAGMFIAQRVQDAERIPFQFIIGMSVFILLLSFVAAYFVLRPLRIIQKGMKRLAQGDFSIRLKTPRLATREFEALIEDFNTMAEELASTELLARNFINDFSHEFKTPIASIRGFAKLLQYSGLEETQRTEFLKTIETESERLSKMAMNVLLLNKVENTALAPNMVRFNVSEQIRGLIVSMQSTWEAKNVEIRPEIDEIYITGNLELLGQVWLNLLDNAIKFSPTDHHIDISLTQEGEELRFTVTNYGEPIEKEKLPRIFDRFYQADASRTTKGNGIGLSIVERIVKMHKGKVEVASGEGEGTKFVVVLAER